MAIGIAPNLFQLSGGTMHVSYATSGLDGQPSFTYQDSSQSRIFRGDKEITVASTMIGTLVTVTLHITPDSGSTMFSLLVPQVALDETGHIAVSTFGVTTVRRDSLIGPPLGQDDSYQTTPLDGMARIVKF